MPYKVPIMNEEYKNSIRCFRERREKIYHHLHVRFTNQTAYLVGLVQKAFSTRGVD